MTSVASKWFLSWNVVFRYVLATYALSNKLISLVRNKSMTSALRPVMMGWMEQMYFQKTQSLLGTGKVCCAEMYVSSSTIVFSLYSSYATAKNCSTPLTE